jgi:hypothetical protein
MSRTGVSFSVGCRVRGYSSSGRGYDLTPEGCLLDCGNGSISAGDSVSLRFDSGIRVSGRVTLLHGRIARVEFEPRLHEGVFAHLMGGTTTPIPLADDSFTRSRRIARAARRLT